MGVKHAHLKHSVTHGAVTVETHLKKPRSTADLFMITESSWLYPVYEAIATMELMPDKQRTGITNKPKHSLTVIVQGKQVSRELQWGAYVWQPLSMFMIFLYKLLVVTIRKFK